RAPAGAIIAIMEIWGVNDTMRHHAHEFAQAGFVCLVPDLFWRQEPGVELPDANPRHVQKAFDLYYDFAYDLAVRDMEDTQAFLQRQQALLPDVLPHRYRLHGRLLWNLYRAPKAKENEDTRAILNAGHRKGAVAGRCVARGTIVETEEIPAYA